MISRTKFCIDKQTINKLFLAAGLGEASEIAPLGAGMYNAVFSVRAGGKDCVLKIAPPAEVKVMTYEKDMMASEIYWYGQMKKFTDIRIPEIYYYDTGKSIIPTDYFIMEKLKGEQLNRMTLSKEEKEQSVAALAEMAAKIHAVKGDKFGYIQNQLHDNWFDAIRSMLTALLDDCAKIGKKSKRTLKLLNYVDQNRVVLEKAECRMVNFDIWAPNIMCNRTEGKIEYAWLDPERSFWGDRIADFVCLEMLTPLKEKKVSISAYNALADNPVSGSDEELIRHAVMQGYLGAIMEIEKYYRFAVYNYGWWQNVLASALWFKLAFGVLKNASK